MNVAKKITQAPQPAPTVTYTLEMSEREASALRSLLGNLRNDFNVQTGLLGLWRALSDAGAPLSSSVGADTRDLLRGQFTPA